jgi:hypothetical protein
MPQFENDWKPILRSDTALNDSDKSFTVPAGKIWRVKWVWVELISTATVGNRQMTIQLQDNTADIIGTIKAGAVQAASITRNYMFSPYAVNLTSFVDTSFLSTPIPELILPQNFIIRAFDSTAVDAAADDMVVHLMVEQYG